MSPGISWAFFISDRLEACFEVDKEMEKGGVTELIRFLLSPPLRSASFSWQSWNSFFDFPSLLGKVRNGKTKRSAAFVLLVKPPPFRSFGSAESPDVQLIIPSDRLEACFEVDKEMEKGGVTELIRFLLSPPLRSASFSWQSCSSALCNKLAGVRRA